MVIKNLSFSPSYSKEKKVDRGIYKTAYVLLNANRQFTLMRSEDGTLRNTDHKVSLNVERVN